MDIEYKVRMGKKLLLFNYLCVFLKQSLHMYVLIGQSSQ